MSLTIDTNFPIDTSSVDLSVSKPLVTLLLENLNFPVYNLTPAQQSSIALFIQHTPAAFDTLKDDIIKITADGKIDLHEIPLMIRILADTYHIYSVNNALLQEDNIIIFIRYTIQLLLDYHFVYLPSICHHLTYTLEKS